MEHEGSFLRSQKPATGPYPEPNEETDINFLHWRPVDDPQCQTFISMYTSYINSLSSLRKCHLVMQCIIVNLI
jgi:hypothetical protein